MLGIALRAALVLVAVVGIALVLWRPWKGPVIADGVTAEAVATAMADGTLTEDDASIVVAPALGATMGEGSHMVRFEMPASGQSPALPQGTEALTFQDLWTAGTTLVPQDGERIGTPDRSLFPEGSTEQDLSDFFLDIGDMRALQPKVGGVRGELDGRRIRMAGYTTPVGFAENETRFLLVAELGACIHVPPPPANQIVYVEAASPTPEMFAAVWVTGTLRVDPAATILADVAYRLEDATTEPYR